MSPHFAAEYAQFSPDEELGLSNISTDVVYYFFTGEANFIVAGESISIEPQQVLFAKGGLDRGFISIDSQVDALVVTLTATPRTDGVNWRSFTFEQLEAGRSANANIWNPFLQQASVIFGFYMLPKSIGGDGAAGARVRRDQHCGQRHRPI